MLYLSLLIALSVFLLKDEEKDIRKISIYTAIVCVLSALQFLLARSCGYSLNSIKETVFQIVWSGHICYTAKCIVDGKMDRKESVVVLAKTVAGILLSSFVMFSYMKGGLNDQGNRYLRLLFSHEFVYLCLLRMMFLCWIYAEEVFEKLGEKKNIIIYYALFVISPLIGAMTCIYAANGDALFDMSYKWFTMTVVLAVLVQIIFANLTHKGYRGLACYHIAIWLFGSVYYYIFEFRGTPLTFADLSAFRTAMEVSGQYQIVLSNEVAFAMSVALGFMMLVLLSGKHCATKEKIVSVHLVRRAVCVALSLFMLVNYTYSMDWKAKYGIRLGNWKPERDYEKYGFPVAFVRSMQQMKIEAPAGYSKEKVRELVEAVPFEKNTDDVKPTIIAIMNESFSDMSVLGELACSDEVMSFYRSLRNDPHMVEYGYDYVSAYGGGTSNTEFEAITADSVKMLEKVHPYQMLNFKNIANLASNLKSEGYQTIAMHPNKAENYRRNSVYTQMGFDEFVDITKYENIEKFGTRPSDVSDYENLITKYEGLAGEPGFIFNVTMQNHGGYSTEQLQDHIERVQVDQKYASYDDLICFQTMIRESNRALQDLLAYFEKVDRPVLLVFFGDHQPKLDEKLLTDLSATGENTEDNKIAQEVKKYKVPYFIWANYEVEKDPDLVVDENGMDITSPFYLSASINKYSGSGETPYTNYVYEMRKKIPAMNIVGYMDAEKKWHSYSDENQTISEYTMAEYAQIYDSVANKALFFTDNQ